MKFNQESPEVMRAIGDIVSVNKDDIDVLNEHAGKAARQRGRYCFHVADDAPLHEMIITHVGGAYVRPHKHLCKSESLHIVQGTAELLLFDADGSIFSRTSVGDYSSGLVFYFRINAAIFHTLIISSEHLVFHETTNGPFNRSDCQFAPWAPDEKDSEAVVGYLKKLKI